MIDNGDSVLAGVSGGPDSIALVLFLMAIKQEFSLKIGIAHINHCLRGDESDRDADFVRDFALKKNITLFLTTKDVYSIANKEKLSLEEAARNVRYSFYNKIQKANNFSKIALAHNFDDNAELVLMNFLRGSGVKGLSGIPPKRDKIIIRPLIEFSKQEILKYLELKNQKYVIDSSNNDLQFLRNRIRHSQIPDLKNKYNPSIIKSLNRLSRILNDEDEWMESHVLSLFNRALIKRDKTEIQLATNVLTNIHRAELRRIIRTAIKKVKGDLKRIALVHIDSVMTLISSSEPGKNLDLPGRIRILKKQDKICFRKESIPLRQIRKKNTI
jgi:tRNA(Ile)-lysidine synthase